MEFQRKVWEHLSLGVVAVLVGVLSLIINVCCRSKAPITKKLTRSAAFDRCINNWVGNR